MLPASGERRLGDLGQAAKPILEVYLCGVTIGPKVRELRLEITYSSAKESHLIEETAVGARCDITEQGLGHL
ncbi:MAG TPA: hypothetical protein VLJ59_20215 [Mycobacteriales bacterium]|nr:hypothetical protein [Mycobacteriales bacterium]